MKGINEKGKLFGIINIIDLVVLVVLVLVISAVGYRFLGNKIGKVTGTKIGTKDITFVVRCQSRDKDSAETTSKALKENNGKLVSVTNWVEGYVVSTSYSNAVETIDTADGRMLSVTNPIKMNLFVTIRMKSDLSSPILRLGSQDVAISSPFRIKNQTVDLTGYVDSVDVK